jgi:hypothetical protein
MTKSATISILSTVKIAKMIIVKSALAGQLYDVLVDEGTTPQTPLAIIGKANSFLLELEVDENDRCVAIGQKAIVMDSYKGERFEDR